MSKALKPLPNDEFGNKYNKEGNIFYNIQASRPIYDPVKERTRFIQVKLQLVIQPDGQVFGRETI